MLKPVTTKLKNRVKNRIIKLHKKSPLVFISDTTLRDGEQMPGASMTPEDKVEIAKALAKIGVHSIDAGFPAAAPSEIQAIQRIVREVKGPFISALCRTTKSDIDSAKLALEEAPFWRRGVSLFIGTSPVHRQDKLKMSKTELIKLVTSSIEYARKSFDMVVFGPEDASRTEIPFLCEIYREAILAGATTIGFPDTIGILTPAKVKETLFKIQDHVPEMDQVLLAVHMHNDLGLATANSLAAVEAGANIVQCTVNGIGERAGNASLEEVVMALKMNQDEFQRQVNIDSTQLLALSRLVAQRSQIPVSLLKPIVGENIFATEAGIHQDGLLKNPQTYLPFLPDVVGAEGIKLVLGKHSGKKAFSQRLEQLGLRLTKEQVNQITDKIIDVEKECWKDADSLLIKTSHDLFDVKPTYTFGQ